MSAEILRRFAAEHGVNFHWAATSNMATFSSTVNGYRANCLFDPQSPVSTVSPSFSRQINIRRGKFGIPVAVNVTTTGVFSCLVELQPGPVDTAYDVMLGRNWFNYCTTTIPDAQILLSDDMCLTFSSSPLLAVRPRHTGEFLLL
jgi:hypothetical protein